MSGGKTIHLRIDIRGMLWDAIDPQQLEGLFTDDGGRALSPREAFDALLDSVQKGHRYIKCGDCDGFDPFEKGCLGHPNEPAPHNQILRGNIDLVPAEQADGWAPR